MDAGQFRDFRNTQLQFTVSLVVNAVMLPLERTTCLRKYERLNQLAASPTTHKDP